MVARWMMLLACGILFITGCESEPPKKEGIIGQKTQDIGKFDPTAKQEVSDSKVRVTDPVTGPLQAYGPMVEQISKVEIDHAVNLFNASEGRYPKDYDEFMTRIIKENNIKLPVLPYGNKYQYDEKAHALVVIRSATDPDKKK